MKTTRREILKSGAALAGWTLLPSGLAMASADLGGGASLQTVSDGAMTLPTDFLYAGLDPAELDPLLAAHGADPKTVIRPCNVTLMRSGERVVLFDLGAGPSFLPGTGKLDAALDALGVGRGEITDVIFTHAHPDHLWGLLDDFDDMVFPDADYYIGRVEWEYWTDPATVDRIGAAQQSFAVGAARRLAELKDRIQLFEGGATLPGGAVAVEAFGHTPGHMAFRVGSDGTLVFADSVADAVVGLARPDWPAAMDIDREAGITTRKRILEMAAAEKIRIVGYHLDAGGIGRIEHAGEGYAFTPEV